LASVSSVRPLLATPASVAMSKSITLWLKDSMMFCRLACGNCALRTAELMLKRSKKIFSL